MPPKGVVYVRKFMGHYYRAKKSNNTYSATYAVSQQEWEKHHLKDPELAKQWKDWCADSKLKIHDRSKKQYGGSSNRKNWMILKGHGHYWRINCHAMLEMGDNYEEFDRWALCSIESVPIPKTREEFRAAVKTLIARKNEYYENRPDQDEE